MITRVRQWMWLLMYSLKYLWLNKKNDWVLGVGEVEKFMISLVKQSVYLMQSLIFTNVEIRETDLDCSCSIEGILN